MSSSLSRFSESSMCLALIWNCLRLCARAILSWSALFSASLSCLISAIFSLSRSQVCSRASFSSFLFTLSFASHSCNSKSPSFSSSCLSRSCSASLDSATERWASDL